MANYDAETDVIDLSGNGKGVALNVSLKSPLVPTDVVETSHVAVTISGSSATVDPTFQMDQLNHILQSVNFTVNNPTGTIIDGKKLVLRFRDAGVAKNITWGSQYRAIADPLPTVTVPNKLMYLGFVYNDTDIRWDLVAVGQEA